MSHHDLARACGIGVMISLFLVLHLLQDIKGELFFEINLDFKSRKWTVHASWGAFLEPPAIATAICLATALLLKLLENFYSSHPF